MWQLKAQEKTVLGNERDSLRVSGMKLSRSTMNPLSPAKAAFYSAVLPGLGQIYNKQYWKVPIVWGAIGAGIYYYKLNTQKYKEYRDAYFNRKKGLTDDFPQYTDDVLIEAQEYYRKQRETTLMLTIVAYFLNIIDANVSAHLKQWNIDDKLSIRTSNIPQFNGKQALGLGLYLKF